MKRLIFIFGLLIISASLLAQTWKPDYTKKEFKDSVNFDKGLQIGGVRMTKTATQLNTVDAKLNISDTASMLSKYETDINVAKKVNIADTATMLTKYARKTSPTFTGTVVLPATTSIGSVSSTEIGYSDGVTSPIQTQLNNTKGGVFNVKDYGAVGDDTHDDTQAIKDAIVAAQDILGDVGYSSIFFPAGVYKVTSTILINHNRISIRGLGKYITQIDFNPTSDTILFKFQGISGGDIAQNEIKDMAILSHNSHIKTAIQATHFEEFNVENINIYPWTSTNTTSIGLKLSYGQQLSVKLIDIWSDRPIVLGNADHFHFADCYLSNNDNNANYPIIEVLDGSYISSISFDGYQAWSGGTYGFYWNDTQTNAVTGNLYFNNIRYEQGNTGSWGFHIVGNCNSCLRDISFTNVFVSSGNGFYLRKATNVGFKNVTTWGTGSNYSIDINSTVAVVNFDNCAFDPDVITTGAIALSGSYRRFPPDIIYPYIDSYFIPNVKTFLINPTINATVPYSQVSSPELTIAANDTAYIGGHQMLGILIIIESVRQANAIYSINGTNIVEVFDAGNTYTPTRNATNSFNILYNSNLHRFVLQNTTSSERHFTINFIGKAENEVDTP